VGCEAAHKVGYMQVILAEHGVADSGEVEHVRDVGDDERDVFAGEQHGAEERDGEGKDASHGPERDEGQRVGEWKLLAYVTAFPAVAAEFDFSGIDAATEEGQVLAEVARWCRSDAAAAKSADAMLIERFQEEPYADFLFHAQAYVLQLKLTQEEAREQILQELRKLDIRRKKLERDELLQRLQKGALSKEEHVRYGTMIAEIKQLEQKLASDGQT